jgi:hypothetical protein
MRIRQFGARLGRWVHTERTGRLLTELVSINGVHFGPERIGDGLYLWFPF